MSAGCANLASDVPSDAHIAALRQDEGTEPVEAFIEYGNHFNDLGVFILDAAGN